MQLKWPMLWDLFSLFPAHAGVIPILELLRKELGTFPRTRGGDPEVWFITLTYDDFSPHTRG